MLLAWILCPFPRYLASLRGHVQRVYQVAWSSDSRLLCSGSADSTLKLWDVKTRKLLYDLPGHADEVRAYRYRAKKSETTCTGEKNAVLILSAAYFCMTVLPIQCSHISVNNAVMTPDYIHVRFLLCANRKKCSEDSNL